MKAKLKAAANAFLAAITSPNVVKAELSVGVLVLTRVLLSVGASAATIELVQQIVKSLGG